VRDCAFRRLVSITSAVTAATVSSVPEVDELIAVAQAQGTEVIEPFAGAEFFVARHDPQSDLIVVRELVAARSQRRQPQGGRGRGVCAA